MYKIPLAHLQKRVLWCGDLRSSSAVPRPPEDTATQWRNYVLDIVTSRTHNLRSCDQSADCDPDTVTTGY